MPKYCVVYVEQLGRGLTCSQFINFRVVNDAAAWDSFTELMHYKREDNSPKMLHVLEMVRIKKDADGSNVEVELVATNSHDVPEFLLSGREARLSEIVTREREAVARKAKLRKQSERFWRLKEFISRVKLWFFELIEPLNINSRSRSKA